MLWRRRFSRVMGVLLFSANGLWSASCATTSTATLTTTDTQADSGFSTDIVSIDGKKPSWGSSELEPGRHVIEVVGSSKALGINGDGSAMAAGLLLGPAGALGANLVALANAAKSSRMKACFIA